MSTSFSTACRATSSGSGTAVRCRPRNPGPANDEAITFWPRSWPSWPIFAIRMRDDGPRVPRTARRCVARSPPVRCGHPSPGGTPRDRTDIGLVATVHAFKGVADLTDGRVHRAAFTDRSSRLPLPSRAAVPTRPARDRRRPWLRAAFSFQVWPTAPCAPRRCRPSAPRCPPVTAAGTC